MVKISGHWTPKHPKDFAQGGTKKHCQFKKGQKGLGITLEGATAPQSGGGRSESIARNVIGNDYWGSAGGAIARLVIDHCKKGPRGVCR